MDIQLVCMDAVDRGYNARLSMRLYSIDKFQLSL
jgi:hypothetical protein